MTLSKQFKQIQIGDTLVLKSKIDSTIIKTNVLINSSSSSISKQACNNYFNN